MENYINARVKELMGMGATFAEAHAAALAEWNAKNKRTGKKGTGKQAPAPKDEPKEEKPKKTRKEAIAEWQEAKGITPESRERYKALVNSKSEFYQSHWDKRESDATYAANKAKGGKSFANKEFHKYILALAAEESKK